jgi:GT2 family glycosyltransferase
MKPVLDVVIVNWRSAELVDACLRALGGATQERFELGWVHVVDNSADEIAYTPRSVGRLRVNFLANRSNRGFGAACNQAAALSRADLLLFLNPDCLLQPDTLDRAVGFLQQQDGRCGALGVQLLDEAGAVQRTCTRFPTARRLLAQALGLGVLSAGRIAAPFMQDWDHRETRAVDQVMGAFLLMPRAVFTEIGGFDERFFLYFEDLDLCVRLHRAGYRVVYFAGAQAVHIGQGSTRKAVGQRQFFFARSRLLYCAKHFGAAPALLLGLASLFVEPVLRLCQALLRGGPGQAAAVFRGARLLWRDLPGRMIEVVRVDSRPGP